MFLITTMVRRKTQAKQIQISCAGAIDQIEISPDLNYGGGWGYDDSDGYDGTIHWNIEVDGVLHVANAGKISGDDWIYMEDWIPENLSSILSAEYQNGLIIKNIDTVPHRIRLIPSGVPSESPIDIAENPTFNIDEQTGVISFCLVPYQISCDGALDRVDLGGFYGRWTVKINGVPLDVPPYEVGNGTTIENWWIPVLTAINEDGRVSLEYDGELHTIWRNNTNENIRVELIGLPDYDSPYLTGIRDYFYDSPEGMNPTLLLENPLENNPQEFNKVSFCLSPKVYYLAIDDKGLVPSDGIYSGTITPPLPGAVLSFNIQQYLPSGNNWRVFNVHSDAQGLVVSPDGATWQVDKANLASWFGNFPDASDFATAATYEFTISKMYGDENIIAGELDYVVN